MFKTLTLEESEFRLFSGLVYERAGINLHDGKMELVKARLAKRIREGGFTSFREYYDFVVGDETGDELVLLLDTLTTNLTSFFREETHFHFLRDEVFPKLRQTWANPDRPGDIRLWSAGCSTGEEPYTLAICILEYFGDASRKKTHILATDLSTRVLGLAAKGIYPFERVGNLPRPILKGYFLQGDGKWKGHVRTKPILREMVEFRRRNLMEPSSDIEHWDVIFCRNVMIYFDRPTQERVLGHLRNALRPKGYLFVGHAESLSGLRIGLKYLKPAVYQKL